MTTVTKYILSLLLVLVSTIMFNPAYAGGAGGEWGDPDYSGGGGDTGGSGAGGSWVMSCRNPYGDTGATPQAVVNADFARTRASGDTTTYVLKSITQLTDSTYRADISRPATSTLSQVDWFYQITCDTPPPPVCKANQTLKDGVCVDNPSPVCEANQTLKDGVCVDNPPVCTANQILKDGKCVDNPSVCKANQTLKDGVCVDNPPDPAKDCECCQQLQDILTTINQTITAFHSDQQSFNNDIKNSVGAINSNINNINNYVNNVDSSVKTVGGNIDNSMRELSLSLGGLSLKLGEINAKIGDISLKIGNGNNIGGGGSDTADINFDKLEKAVRDVEIAIKNHDKNVLAKIDEAMKQAHDDNQKLQDKLDKINEKLDKINENLEKMQKCNETEFNKKMCDLADWFQKKHDPDNDTNVKINDGELPDIDTGKVKFQSQCPAPKVIETVVNGVAVREEMDYSPLCEFFTRLKPFVEGMGWVGGAFIIAGVRRG